MFQSIAQGEDLYRFTSDVVRIVEKMPGGDPLLESSEKFKLTSEQADQVLSYSKVNSELNSHMDLKIKPEGYCLVPSTSNPTSTPSITPIAPHVAILGISHNILAETLLSAPTPAEQVYNQLFINPNDWKNILAANKYKLTSDQKIELVSKLGTFFSNGYNYARFNDKDTTDFVSIEQLLVSAKTGKPGGICRDIALAQTQMLEALGFKDNYSVSYKTYDGEHVSVITVDPTTGKIIKFNYGGVSTSNRGSGTDALAQDSTQPDFGLSYRIYDSKGKPVVKVPSELGQILTETTGGVDREFNSKNYNLVKIGFDKNGIKGNFFSGRTTNGEFLNGVALFREDENEHFKKHVGGALVLARSSRALTTSSADHLYLNAGAEVRSNSFNIGPGKTKMFAGIEASIMRSNVNIRLRESGLELSGKGVIDTSIDGFLGLESEVKLQNGKSVIQNQTYINIYPDLGNVAKAHQMVMATNSVVIDTKLTHQLSDEDKAILLNSSFIIRKYGTSVVLEAGLENKNNKSRYLAGVRAPLDSQPTFLPGGSASSYVRSEKEISSGVNFVLELEKGVTSGPSARAGLEGKFD